MGRVERLLRRAEREAGGVAAAVADLLHALGRPVEEVEGGELGTEEGGAQRSPGLRQSSLCHLRPLGGERESWEPWEMLMEMWDPLKPAESPTRALGSPLSRSGKATGPRRTSSSLSWPLGSQDRLCSAGSSSARSRSAGSGSGSGSLGSGRGRRRRRSGAWPRGSLVDVVSSEAWLGGDGSGAREEGDAELRPALHLRFPPSAQPASLTARLHLPANARLYLNRQLIRIPHH